MEKSMVINNLTDEDRINLIGKMIWFCQVYEWDEVPVTQCAGVVHGFVDDDIIISGRRMTSDELGEFEVEDAYQKQINR